MRHPALRLEIARQDLGLPGQRMALAADNPQHVIGQRFGLELQIGRERTRRPDHEVDLPGGQLRFELGQETDPKLDPTADMAGQEIAEDRRQQIVGQRRGRSDQQAARLPGGQMLRIGAGLIFGGQHHQPEACEGGAQVGGHRLPPDALEYRRAETFLELFHAFAQRRLCDVQLGRRRAERAALHDGGQLDEVSGVDLHGRVRVAA